MKDDATYTVTISGPGFSVTAECDFALEPAELSRCECLAILLSRAIGMLVRASEEEESLLLAEIVGSSADSWRFASWNSEEIRERTKAFVDASQGLSNAWDEEDKKQAAVVKKILATAKTSGDIATTDDRGGV